MIHVLSREGATIRRRRECIGCSHRFTTYEEVEHEGLMVLKARWATRGILTRKTAVRHPQSPPKTPCQALKSLEDLVDHIVATVTVKFEKEVPGEAIGKMVMDGLRELDVVAYVRFASVYRRFEEATDFVQEIQKTGGH